MKKSRRRNGRTDYTTRTGARATLGRVLRAEALEQRQLMAGDVIVAPHQNSWFGKDVNNDLRLTPIDALLVINDLNTNGVRDLREAPLQPSKFLDVNGDNFVTALDALQVINALNTGSGESTEAFVEVMLGLTDNNGNSLVNQATRTAELNVGEVVNLEVLYRDLRLFGEAQGLFTVYTDILLDQNGFLEPVMSERQELELSSNFNTTRGGSVTVSQEGKSVTATIPWAEFATDRATAISSVLVSTFGYTSSQFEVSTNDAFRASTDPYITSVQFVGAEFEQHGVDVPDLFIDASALTTNTGAPAGVTSDTNEIVPYINGKPNPDAVVYFLDPESRTARGQSFYDGVVEGSFNDDPNDGLIDGFSYFGSLGDTTSLKSFLSTLNPPINYVGTTPFEAFSVRVRVTKPVQGLDLQLQVPADPANPTETALLIYGPNPNDPPNSEDRGLYPHEIILDNDARITLNVTDVITARLDEITTAEDTTSNPVNVLANDSNLGTAPLTVISFTSPTNGSVTRTGSSFRYTPNPDYFGADQFTYTVENGDGKRAIGTVTVTVTPVNDPPVAVDDVLDGVEDTPVTLTEQELFDAILANDSAGPANEQQTISLVSVSQGSAGGTWVDNGNGTYTYTPPANLFGQAAETFVYTIADSGNPSLQDTATITVNLAAVNDPPTAGDDTIQAVEDTPLTFTEQEFYDEIFANDSPGPANEGQTLSLASYDTTGSAGGTITDNGNGTFTYTPPANVFGIAAETFKYTVADGGVPNLTATATITIDIEAVNDAPIANNDLDLTVDELSTDNEIDVLANDSAGPLEDGIQTILIASVSSAQNGTVTISADKTRLIYTPNADYIGPDSFTYTITDGQLVSAPATVTLSVDPIVRPRARGDKYSVLEDSGLTSLAVTSNDLANPGATVTLQSVAPIDPAVGMVAVNGNFVNFTPADDYFGQVVFTYTISDTSNPEIDTPEEIAAATGTVTVTVTAVNDNPIVGADPIQTATEDTELQINGALLLSNDVPGPPNEVGTQTLSILSVVGTTAQGGSARLENGMIYYQGRQDYNSNMVPTDTVTYVVSDGVGGTTTTQVTISVTPVNDAPVLSLATGLQADEDEDTFYSFASILGSSMPGPATATDEASQTLSIFSVGNGTTSSGGTVSIQGSEVVYRGPLNFFGSDSFTVTVRDSAGAQTVGNVTITVNNVNDAPVFFDPPLQAFSKSVATFTSAQLLALSNVGPGEAGLPGQVLSVVSVTAIPGQTIGQLSFNAGTGNLTYTPVQDQEYTDVVRVVISDGSLTTEGTATIVVREFEPSTISGNVFFDLIESYTNPVRNRVQDAHEPGLEMVQIRLVSGASENVTGEAINHALLTDVDGNYEFTNVPPGQYRLVFDMPLMVFDGPDARAGAVDSSDSVENQFTINVAEPGGFVFEDHDFTVLGYSGRAGNALDLLVSSYLASNPDIAAASQNGMLGAKAYVDSSGTGKWFSSKGGFDDVLFGEINIDQSGTIVTLSVIMEDGSVKTGIVPSSRRMVMADGTNGFVVQIFGDLNSFQLGPDGMLNPGELGILKYQQAVDRVLAQDSSVI